MVVLVFAYLWVEPQPKCQGKPLIAWLQDYGGPFKEKQAAAESVLRHLDAKDLRRVVRILTARETPGIWMMDKMLRWLPLSLARPISRYLHPYDLSVARAAAAQVLSWYQPLNPQALQALEKAAQGKDLRVRLAALQALSRCGPDGVRVLARLLQKAPSGQETFIVSVIGDAGKAAAVALEALAAKVQAYPPRNVWPSYAKAFRAAGEEGFKTLLRLLQTTEGSALEATTGILTLWISQDYDRLKRFIALWPTFPKRARLAAIQALAGAKGWESVRYLALAEAIRDEEPEVRQAAAKVLQGLGERAVVGIVTYMEALKDPKPGTRRLAIELLAQCGAKAQMALSRLQKLATQDPDPQVRKAAQQAIQKIQASPGS